MEEKKNKCPLCSRRLVMKNGVPTCPDCGYRDPYRSGGSQPQTDYNSQSGYGQTSQSGSSVSGYGQTSQSGGSVSGYGQTSQTGGSRTGYGRTFQAGGNQPKIGPYGAVVSPDGDTKKKTSTVFVITFITIFAVFMVISVVGGVIVTFMSENNRYGADGGGHRESSAAVAPALPVTDMTGAGESSLPSSSQGGIGSVSHLTFSPPESELLQEFVSQLFGKPASSVTREELNSVVGLKIRDTYDYSVTEIDYELSDGTTGTCYLSSGRVDSEDFVCFPGIRALDLGRNSLDWNTDWHGLTSLTWLACGTSLEELSGCMDVSQLTSLRLCRGLMMSDCSGLEAYGNLEYLSMDCSGFGMDLTGLSQAPVLKTLILEDADSVTDYKELYNMPGLRELSIESDGLRDIGFISGMSGLESLELISTGLLRIDAVADRADTLKCLRLHRNDSVEDYSAVFACTGLEELELYVDYDFGAGMTMPDLSMMSGLKSLTLGNYDKFPGLADLTALESLTLTGAGFFGNAEGLGNMEKLVNLKSLSILDASIEPELLEMFAGAVSLEKVDLTDTFVWGDLNTLFALPNLKELILEEADFGLMLEGMPVSESLLALDLTDADVHRLKEDGSYDYGASNTDIMLGNYTEFFDHMPNLTVLKVPEQELQDVRFAEKLTQLVFLDITDNYVVDLSPLAGLGQLKVVVCGNNPVNGTTGLKNVIVID